MRIVNMDKNNGKTQDQYLRALIDIEYVFEGAMTPYVVLKETAKCMKDQKDLTAIPCLELGVAKKWLSDYSIRTFKAMLGDNWQEGEVLGIPYKISIIEGNWKVFDYPDSFIYWGGIFKTGNPWDSYWRSRFLIK